ncbi:aarF domain-containing protein kinase 1-like [Styela clava]
MPLRLLKVGGALLGAFAGGGILMSYYDVTPLRSARVAKTTLSIILDYKLTLRKFDNDTDEYERALSEAHTRSAHKIYDLCCINKGTYIKMGQLLGALDYILPREYTTVLKVFHDDAPKSTLQEIESVVKNDLCIDNLDELFINFSPEPIGTASLAQVHTAILRSTGEKVAVKVQHPKVREHADFDMKVTDSATRLAAKIFPEFNMVWLSEETQKHLPLELDFLHEGKNAEKVAEQLKCFEWLKVPKIHWNISSERVLVMEYCEGGQVNDLGYFKRNNIDCNHVSRLLGKLFSEMIFVHGFVHCDPHPGNVLVKRRSDEERKILDGSFLSLSWIRSFLPFFLGGKSRCSEVELVLLDHGLYQTLDDDFRYEYAGLWQGLISANVKKIKQHSSKFGVGDMYPLFATMITVRSWEVVCEGGIKRTKFSEDEDNSIRTEVPGFLPGISKILNTVPRPMVMLFKTNDLLRMLEVLHGTRSDSSGFLNMSKCCVRAVSDYEGRHDTGSIQKFRRSLLLKLDLVKIVLYEYLLWIQTVFAFS